MARIDAQSRHRQIGQRGRVFGHHRVGRRVLAGVQRFPERPVTGFLQELAQCNGKTGAFKACCGPEHAARVIGNRIAMRYEDAMQRFDVSPFEQLGGQGISVGAQLQDARHLWLVTRESGHAQYPAAEARFDMDLSCAVGQDLQLLERLRRPRAFRKVRSLA